MQPQGGKGKGGTTGGDGRACFTCGKTGHFGRDCLEGQNAARSKGYGKEGNAKAKRSAVNIVVEPFVRIEDSRWPDFPTMEGEGRKSGQWPRSAGIIAICMIEEEPHVCVCQKANGKASFPKGGIKYNQYGETVLAGAKREWREEAGLPIHRLQLLQGVHLDEPYIGCRYLFARCDPPALGSNDRDAEAKTWQPPEDPKDDDPIVKSSWLPVTSVLAGSSHLHVDRCKMLAKAAVWLQAGETFIRLGSGANANELAAAAAASTSRTATSTPPTSTLTHSEKEVFALAKKVRKLKQKGEMDGTAEIQTAFARALASLPSDSDIREKFADIAPDMST